MYKLPNSINNKRTGSLHLKKPSNHSISNESDISRIQSSTPITFQSKRSLADQLSPNRMKLNILHQMFETPKPQRGERRNLSLADSNKFFSNESNEKLKPIQYPITANNEEKYLSTIINLTRENEKLKMRLEKSQDMKKLKKKRLKILKNLKKDDENWNQVIETFLRKMREEIDKVTNYLIQVVGEKANEEAQSMISVFNQGLFSLRSMIGEDGIKSLMFVKSDEYSGLSGTAKFKSLGESEESIKIALNEFGLCREAVAMADFMANVHGQLQFKVGDRIQLIKTDDSEWWLGRIGEKIGRIPSRLVMLD